MRLQDLERAMKALADGNFDVRVPVDGIDELSRLAESFNTMADRLVSLRESVKSHERQVMFGRVVAGLLHDLTHPIQSIGNNARLLLRTDVDPQSRAAIGLTLEREFATLQRVMDDVLNVARPRPLDKVLVDLNASVADIVDAMRAEADRAQVRLEADFAPGRPAVAADRFALGRICRNLIANAIQATGPQGTVTVTTALAGAWGEIRVADTGAGIAPDRLGAIFDDFVTTKRRGLGLGLATSRRLVEQLGGTIAVASEVGRGTTFTVRFEAGEIAAAEAVS
jgi:two-component system sensor histidine kinase AtoS